MKNLRYKNIPMSFKGISIQERPLDQVTSKGNLSIFDYIIILSTMYGIGAAIGMIGGTSHNVLPNRKEKPVVFAVCVGLLLLGANRGWSTAKRTDEVKKLLSGVDYNTLRDEVSSIQQKAEDYIRV